MLVTTVGLYNNCGFKTVDSNSLLGKVLLANGRKPQGAQKQGQGAHKNGKLGRMLLVCVLGVFVYHQDQHGTLV